jgi:hypothetical protein
MSVVLNYVAKQTYQFEKTYQMIAPGDSILRSMDGQGVSKWEGRNFDTHMLFADFAEGMGVITQKAKEDYLNNSIIANRYRDAGIKAQFGNKLPAENDPFNFDFCQTSDLPFAQFSNLFVGCNAGFIDAQYQVKACNLLDYHLSVLSRG